MPIPAARQAGNSRQFLSKHDASHFITTSCSGRSLRFSPTNSRDTHQLPTRREFTRPRFCGLPSFARLVPLTPIRSSGRRGTRYAATSPLLQTTPETQPVPVYHQTPKHGAMLHQIIASRCLIRARPVRKLERYGSGGSLPGSRAPARITRPSFEPAGRTSSPFPPPATRHAERSLRQPTAWFGGAYAAEHRWPWRTAWGSWWRRGARAVHGHPCEGRGARSFGGAGRAAGSAAAGPEGSVFACSAGCSVSRGGAGRTSRKRRELFGCACNRRHRGLGSKSLFLHGLERRAGRVRKA